MRVFLSYRRADTGGRAGRLRDALVDHFGEQTVFHDVTDLAPGTPFDAGIDGTIEESDVVLVVIGRQWLDAPDPAGGRRLDRADDLVRHEIRTALAQDKRVVPVLVDDARLPAALELPDDIALLVRRQAVTIRDEAWHQDVRELVRRLAIDPVRPHKRRVLAVLAGSSIIVATSVALVVSVRTLLDGDGGGAGNDEPTGCPATDGWTEVSPSGPPVEVTLEDKPVRLEPRSARYRPDGGAALVVVEVALTNLADPVPDTFDDNLHFSYGQLSGLLVAGVLFEPIQCSDSIGDPEAAPGQTAIRRFGFESGIDPAGATIDLATDGDGIVRFGVG